MLWLRVTIEVEKEEGASEKGQEIVFSFSSNFFFFPFLAVQHVVVAPNWKIARLDTAAFAKRSQTALAAGRTVNVEKEINKRYSFNEICFLKNILFMKVLCASRQRMANGKCLPLDNVRVAFPPFFLLCGNICPSTRSHATS